MTAGAPQPRAVAARPLTVTLLGEEHVQETGNPTVGQVPQRRVRMGAAAAFGVLFLFALVTTIGSLPIVCSVCHASQASATDATAHADMDCYACHLANGAWGFPEQKTEELLRMYPAALIGRGLTRPAAATARSACLDCHEDILQDVTEGTRLSIDHRVCTPEPTCDGCHAGAAHGTSLRWQLGPVMEECVACHSEKGAAITCDSCHTADEDRRPADAAKGPWQVTHGPNWQKTHGLGDVGSCVTCHPSDYCTRCHGVAVPHPQDFGGTHGTLAIEKPAVCTRCHASRKDFCDSCHTMEMPHPKGFLVEHSTIAKSRTDARCFHCHADTDCALCHEAHVHPGGSKGVPVPWTYTPERNRP